jgi:DNA invertase Pin-like site-specific DNA recombinase
MKTQRAAIYTRVSTLDQHPEVQEKELVQYVNDRGWRAQKIYIDRGVSGAIEKRPALDEMLADCRRRKIDIVVVWKFDRFARSLRQLLNALELFRKLGIGFVSCTEAIDTSLPAGECLFQVVGAVAQLERSLIAERVRAGLQHARLMGKRLGRPPLRQLSGKEVAQLRRERTQYEAPFRTLAQKYGVSVWTAHRLCSKRIRSMITR